MADEGSQPAAGRPRKGCYKGLYQQLVTNLFDEWPQVPDAKDMKVQPSPWVREFSGGPRPTSVRSYTVAGGYLWTQLSNCTILIVDIATNGDKLSKSFAWDGADSGLCRAELLSGKQFVVCPVFHKDTGVMVINIWDADGSNARVKNVQLEPKSYGVSYDYSRACPGVMLLKRSDAAILFDWTHDRTFKIADGSTFGVCVQLVAYTAATNPHYVIFVEDNSHLWYHVYNSATGEIKTVNMKLSCSSNNLTSICSRDFHIRRVGSSSARVIAFQHGDLVTAVERSRVESPYVVLGPYVVCKAAGLLVRFDPEKRSLALKWLPVPGAPQCQGSQCPEFVYGSRLINREGSWKRQI